jgi:hypothetical protein
LLAPPLLLVNTAALTNTSTVTELLVDAEAVLQEPHEHSSTNNSNQTAEAMESKLPVAQHTQDIMLQCEHTCSSSPGAENRHAGCCW